MKLWIASALAMLVTVSFAPAASAVNLCDAYDICLPDPTPPGCTASALVVRMCGGAVYVCTFDYMGGGGTTPLGNLRWSCDAVTA